MSVERFVGSAKNIFNGVTVMGILSHTHARGNAWSLRVLRKTLRNPVRHLARLLKWSFRQNQCELIAAVARRRIDVAAMHLQNIRDATKCAASDYMAVRVVNFFQAVEVQQQNGKRSSRATVSPNLRVYAIEQQPIVSKAGQRIRIG